VSSARDEKVLHKLGNCFRVRQQTTTEDGQPDEVVVEVRDQSVCELESIPAPIRI
jgi:hypothetical protein